MDVTTVVLMPDLSFRPNRTAQRLRTSPFPSKYRPMLMHAQAEPFARQDWLFEPKLDGMRAIVVIEEGECRILSRNGLEYGRKYPALAAELRATGKDVVLDGEIVAFDATGAVSFEQLQERIRMGDPKAVSVADKRNPVVFYAFDILRLDGIDLTKKPLFERKNILATFLRESNLVRLIQSFPDDGTTLFSACSTNGLEGIVAKNGRSRYQCGARSKDWIKVKLYETADVVIGGHKKDVGFLVGRYSHGGEFRYVGSVSAGLRGTDYDYLDANLSSSPSCPFENALARWQAVWFSPEIVAEVKFMHWTSGGYLRMPSFIKLRHDIDAHNVHD